VVVGGRGVDGGGDEADGSTARFTCNFLYMCSGLLRLRWRLHAGLGRGCENFSRADRPPAEVAGKSRLQRQTRRRNRKRRYIRNARAGHGRGGRTRCHAAEVAVIHSVAAVAGTLLRIGCEVKSRRGWRTRLCAGKNVFVAMYLFNQSRQKPEKIKKWLLGMAQRALGPGYDMAKHFTPHYNLGTSGCALCRTPICFLAIKSGKASVVTDEIESFTENGLRLRSGEELEADIIVTATGLKVQLMGGMEVCVDGAPVTLSRAMSYKGMMYSDVPNLASSFGYTNASWTLKYPI